MFSIVEVGKEEQDGGEVQGSKQRDCWSVRTRENITEGVGLEDLAEMADNSTTGKVSGVG